MAAAFGLGDDPVPVTCEPFRQWVIEDRFPASRPALEKVGAIFTPRVHDFETMKIRILNGGHAAIGYPAELLGIGHVHEAMADGRIAAFLDKIETDEIVPIIPPVPGHDLHDYKALILRRFSNPEIADTAHRLCFDGSNRQPKFIIPSIRDNIARGVMPTGLILASALWCRYCEGTDSQGRTTPPNDPHWDMLTTTARAAKQDSARWIGMRAIYGDLSDDPAFEQALRLVWNDGMGAALAHYTEG